MEAHLAKVDARQEGVGQLEAHFTLPQALRMIDPGIALPTHIIHPLAHGRFPATLHLSKAIFTQGVAEKSPFARDLDQLARAITQETPAVELLRPFHLRNTPIRAKGRSLHLPLNEPYTLENLELTAISAKGVTNEGQSPTLEPYCGRSKTGMVNSRLTLEVRDGNTYLVPSPAQPTGFMDLDSAQLSYQAASQLIKLGIPVVPSLGYGKFDEITFQSKPLGFVLLGHSHRGNFKKDNLGDQRVDQLEVPALFHSALTKSFHALRALHEAGFTHGQPHLGNFVAHCNMQDVLFTDLETFQDHKALGHTPEERALFIARDLHAFAFSAYRELHKFRGDPRPNKSPDNQFAEAFGQGYLREGEVGLFPPSTMYTSCRAELDIHTRQDLPTQAIHNRPLEEVLQKMKKNRWIREVLAIHGFS